MVLDQQDSHGPAFWRCRRDGWRGASVRLFAGGKDQRKRGTFISPGAFRGDRSFMGIDKRFADCKAETQTSELRPASLLKSVKDFRQRFRLNPEAGIDYFHMQLIACIITRGNTNLTAFGCKLNSVLDEIPKDLLESRWVGLQMNFVGSEIEPKRQVFSIDIRLTNLESILQQRMSVNDFKIELDLASANTR